jgi:integrase
MSGGGKLVVEVTVKNTKARPKTDDQLRSDARALAVRFARAFVANRFGTHSLRRTKATLIYRRTGNLRAVRLLLGRTKIESLLPPAADMPPQILTAAECQNRK